MCNSKLRPKFLTYYKWQFTSISYAQVTPLWCQVSTFLKSLYALQNAHKTRKWIKTHGTLFRTNWKRRQKKNPNLLLFIKPNAQRTDASKCSVFTFHRNGIRNGFVFLFHLPTTISTYYESFCRLRYFVLYTSSNVYALCTVHTNIFIKKKRNRRGEK